MKHLSLTKPHLIVAVGVPGSGKSFFAEKFATTFGAPYISDEKLGKLVEGDIPAVVQLQLEELLKTKQSIVYDGPSSTRTERLELAKKAREAEYVPLFIWVQTDQATAKSRHQQVNKTTPAEEYDKRLKRFTAPSTAEKPLVISGKHTYASQAKVVLKKLSAPRAEISVHQKSPVTSDRPAHRNIIVR